MTPTRTIPVTTATPVTTPTATSPVIPPSHHKSPSRMASTSLGHIYGVRWILDALRSTIRTRATHCAIMTTPGATCPPTTSISRFRMGWIRDIPLVFRSATSAALFVVWSGPFTLRAGGTSAIEGDCRLCGKSTHHGQFRLHNPLGRQNANVC
jgi:hypothetical protein